MLLELHVGGRSHAARRGRVRRRSCNAARGRMNRPRRAPRQIGHVERAGERREQRRFVREIFRRAKFDQRTCARTSDTLALDFAEILPTIVARCAADRLKVTSFDDFENGRRFLVLKAGIARQIRHSSDASAPPTRWCSAICAAAGRGLVVERVDATRPWLQVRRCGARTSKAQRDSDRVGAGDFA